MVNSFIPWVGGKRLMRDIILQRFPLAYNRYIEVFGGAGWILFAKDPEPFEVYNDYNSNLTNLFFVVKYKYLQFLEELGFFPLNSKTEFEWILQFIRREDFSLPFAETEIQTAARHLKELELAEYHEMLSVRTELGDVRRAVNFYKLIRYSYAGNSKSYNGQPVNILGANRTIWLANRRLNENGFKSNFDLARAEGNVGKGVIIQNKSYEEVIALYDCPTAFFYCDPPYYGTESQYTVLFSLEDHYNLFRILSNIEGKFMLSYNDCSFIRELYKDFHTESFERLNSISQKNNPGGMYKELLITNYDPNERRNHQPKQLTLL